MALTRSCSLVLLGALCAGNTQIAAAAEETQSQPFEKPSATMTVLYNTESVLGKSVFSDSGERMGQIVDVLAGPAGRVRAAIIDFGGFLGIGSKKIAVKWSCLRFDPDGRVVITDVSRDRLAQAPGIKEGEPVIAVGTDPRPYRRADAFR
ncbi:MAG: PRC-barrel domain-containing protein [Rhodomicrobium sp.]